MYESETLELNIELLKRLAEKFNITVDELIKKVISDHLGKDEMIIKNLETM